MTTVADVGTRTNASIATFCARNLGKKWSSEEDAKLLDAVVKKNRRWSKIVKSLPNRTEAMCRNRFSRIQGNLRKIEQTPNDHRQRRQCASKANVSDRRSTASLAAPLRRQASVVEWNFYNMYVRNDSLQLANDISIDSNDLKMQQLQSPYL